MELCEVHGGKSGHKPLQYFLDARADQGKQRSRQAATNCSTAEAMLFVAQERARGTCDTGSLQVRGQSKQLATTFPHQRLEAASHRSIVEAMLLATQITLVRWPSPYDGVESQPRCTPFLPLTDLGRPARKRPWSTLFMEGHVVRAEGGGGRL